MEIAWKFLRGVGQIAGDLAAALRILAERRIRVPEDSGIPIQFAAFLEEFRPGGRYNHGDNYLSYFETHYRRYLETYRLMEPFVGTGRASFIEFGMRSPLSLFIEEGGNKVDDYQEDLRYPFKLSDASYDYALCLEVIEHIKDRDSSSMDDLACFNLSGIHNFVMEARRIIRPGGHLFMTTPNACSLQNLGRMLIGEQPMLFKPHVREWAIGELKDLFQEGGLRLKKVVTFDPWPWTLAVPRERMLRFLGTTGYPLELRGDDAFLVFQRPL